MLLLHAEQLQAKILQALLLLAATEVVGVAFNQGLLLLNSGGVLMALFHMAKIIEVGDMASGVPLKNDWGLHCFFDASTLT